MVVSRRSLLKSSLVLPGLSFAQHLFAQDRERFFLHIVVRGGADCSYLFDARAKAFTDRQLIQNYLGTERDRWPVMWQDPRGARTLVSALVDEKLSRFRDSFSIVNGVHMAPGFDGHEENVRYSMTGDAAGGTLAELQLDQGPAPLSFLLAGSLSGTEAPSLHRGLNIGVETAVGLAELFRSDIDGHSIQPAVLEFVLGRSQHCATGAGSLARGCAQYITGINQAPDLKTRVAQVAIPDFNEDEITFSNQLELVRQYFAFGICRSAILSLEYDLDAHDTDRARAQVENFTTLVDDIAVLLAFLGQPFTNGGGTIGERVTVVLHSEFNRTMRQLNAEFAETGTDHNPLSNSVLLAGKGFRKGRIFGETDLDQLSDEGGDTPFAAVSAAHHHKDRHLIKLMGKPFDHQTATVQRELPAEFNTSHYLQFPSLLNTIFQSFGVSRDSWLTLDRRGTVAPSIPGLLT